jgi:hypothetical protein
MMEGSGVGTVLGTNISGKTKKKAFDWLIILQGNTEQHQITLIAQLLIV